MMQLLVLSISLDTTLAYVATSVMCPPATNLALGQNYPILHQNHMTFNELVSFGWLRTICNDVKCRLDILRFFSYGICPHGIAILLVKFQCLFHTFRAHNSKFVGMFQTFGAVLFTRTIMASHFFSMCSTHQLKSGS